jgi:hypothetical protein
MPQRQPWERRFCREVGASVIIKISFLISFIRLNISGLPISVGVNATHLRQWIPVPRRSL